MTNETIVFAAAAGGIALATSALAMPLNSLARGRAPTHRLTEERQWPKRTPRSHSLRLIRIALPFRKRTHPMKCVV
jgi:hypothetical protein